jgi:hypothetical protein
LKQNSNETITEEIQKILEPLQLKQRIEIIAQLFIRWGLSLMLHKTNTTLSSTEAINLIIQDRKNNGETLGNALAHQGLLLLMWLGE